MPTIWPYLEKRLIEKTGINILRGSYVTLSHDEILTNEFCGLIVGRCRCGLRYCTRYTRDARVSCRHKLYCSIYFFSPLDLVDLGAAGAAGDDVLL